MQVSDVPELTIGIPTLDRPEQLACLLTSLMDQTYNNFDTIIVSQSMLKNSSLMNNLVVAKLYNVLKNRSDDFTRHIIIDKEPIGAAAAHNIVLYMSRTPYILRVDDDIILEPTFVEELLSTIEANQIIGAVGGIYLDPDQSDNQYYDAKLKDKIINEGMTIRDDTGKCQMLRHRDESVMMRVTDLYSTFVYRKDAMIQAGGFCEKYGRACYFEDTDGSYRIYMEGFMLLVDPSAVGWHLKSLTGGSRLFWTEEKSKRNEKIFWKEVEKLEARGRKTLK